MSPTCRSIPRVPPRLILVLLPLFKMSLGAVSHAWLACSLLAAAASAQAPFRVFMIASKAEDHIRTSTAAKAAMEEMGKAAGFTVDYTTDTSLISEANLARYDVFFQMHLAPFEFSASRRAVLEKWVAAGKGWLGIHAAGLTGDQFGNGSWPWYTAFFGGVTYVNHPALQNGSLVFEDRTHPVTRNMSAAVTVKDEWYEWSGNPRPRVRVLGKADESTYSPLKRQGDHPILWSNESHAKMLYIGVGHDPSVWANPTYVLLVRDALLWLKEKPAWAPPRGSRGVSAAAWHGWIRVGGMPGFHPGAGGAMDARGRSLPMP